MRQILRGLLTLALTTAVVSPALALDAAGSDKDKPKKEKHEKKEKHDAEGSHDSRHDDHEGMRFHGMDTNGDGVITRAEWRGNDVSFRNHDLDGDGVLSGAEVTPGGHDDEGDDREPRTTFERLDSNDDGVISRTEWPDRWGTDRFRALDSNHDGVISPAEWADHDRDRADRVLTFDRLDRNDDGVISRAEWPERLGAERFRRLDRNDDGVISRAEFQTWGRR